MSNKKIPFLDVNYESIFLGLRQETDQPKMLRLDLSKLQGLDEREREVALIVAQVTEDIRASIKLRNPLKIDGLDFYDNLPWDELLLYPSALETIKTWAKVSYQGLAHFVLFKLNPNNVAAMFWWIEALDNDHHAEIGWDWLNRKQEFINLKNQEVSAQRRKAAHVRHQKNSHESEAKSQWDEIPQPLRRGDIKKFMLTTTSQFNVDERTVNRWLKKWRQ